MKIIRHLKMISIVLSVLIFTSCAARMKVKVSAADRDEIIKKVEADLKKEMPAILENVKFLIAKGNDINKRYYDFLKKNLDNESYELEINRYTENYEIIKNTQNLSFPKNSRALND